MVIQDDFIAIKKSFPISYLEEIEEYIEFASY